MSIKDLFLPTLEAYIPYKDGEGNILAANEILFATEEEYIECCRLIQSKKENYFVGAYKEPYANLLVTDEDILDHVKSIDSEGIEKIYDNSGNFPVSLMYDGKVLNIKISAITGEVLPQHAGTCPCIDIVYSGAPSSGKTVYCLQLSDDDLHNAIARNKNCSFENDYLHCSDARERYENLRDDLKISHKLPESTKMGEFIEDYVYHVTVTDENKNSNHILLRFQDIAGEEYMKPTCKKRLFVHDYFFLMIGADELLNQEKGEKAVYNAVVDGMLTRLKVLNSHYKLVVIISKADLLDRDNPYLRDILTENSVEVRNNGHLYQTTHKDGFDREVFDRRSEAVRAYLRELAPNFYNKLYNAVGSNLTFCLMASIGEDVYAEKTPEGESIRKFRNYRPYCIDEPLLKLLADNVMYPVIENENTSNEQQILEFETVKPYTESKIMIFILDGLKKLKEKFCYFAKRMAKETVKNDREDYMYEKYGKHYCNMEQSGDMSRGDLKSF